MTSHIAIQLLKEVMSFISRYPYLQHTLFCGFNHTSHLRLENVDALLHAKLKAQQHSAKQGSEISFTSNQPNLANTDSNSMN